jgi:hypothetical protein
MNPYLKLIIFIAIDIYIFKNFGKIFGFLGLGIIIYRLLNFIGLLRSPKIYRGAFNEGVVYLKDYLGKYYNPEAFKEALDLIKTYDLKNFIVIGIYYDRPDNSPDSQYRSSIGIYCKNSGFPDKMPEEFENFCKENNYYSVEFPTTSSVYSSWEYSNYFTMMMGILKFYSIIKKGLEDASFRKMYRISEKSKISIELYSTESKMEFFIPTVDEDKFNVYRKEVKPKSE